MIMQISDVILCMPSRKCLIKAVLLIHTVTAHAIALDEAIESAIKNDPSLRASKMTELATEENIAIARSRLLPQITIQGSSSQLTQTTIQDLPTGGSTSRSFSGPSINHQIVLRQALIRPKEISSLRYAELHTEYIGLKYKSELAELRLRVASAWIDLLCTHQIVKANEKSLLLLEMATEQERKKYEQGDGTKDAVMEAFAQYENAKASHLLIIESFKVKKNGFEKLTRRSVAELNENHFTALNLTQFPEIEKTSVWEKIQDTSLELSMARLQEKMQVARLELALADHKPTLDLVSAVNLAQNDATSTQGYQYKNKQIGLQYSIPLYSGGGVSASVTQAKLSYEASLSETEALNMKIENEFENNWSLYTSSQKKLKALLNLLKSQEEINKATNKSFELGIKTLADISTAENTLSKRVVDVIYQKQEILKLMLRLKIGVGHSFNIYK